MTLQPGLVYESGYTVQENDTAASSGGSKLPKVLSTPRIIGWMEGTAHRSILDQLTENQTSVGTVVNIRHLAATPVGMEVKVRVELVAVDGRKMSFKVEAWDTVEKIAEGEHERFIIDIDRFIQRLEKKQNSR
jgi:fluoroacetyl-CoA thioesterase